MIIHVAHLDPYNGNQQLMHASTREALVKKVADFYREFEGDKMVVHPDAPDDDVLEYLSAHSESSVYLDTIEVDAYDAATTQAAQIVWEAMLDAFDMPGQAKPWQDGPPQWLQDLLELKNSIGAYEMRDLATRLAVEIEDQWVQLPQELQEAGISFDWELIPELLSVIPWLGDCKLPEDAVLNEMEAQVKAMGARFFAQLYPNLDAYKAALEKAAGRRWGYPELISEEGVDSVIAGAFEARTDPDAFVEEQGKEHDLNDPDPITMQDLARIYR